MNPFRVGVSVGFAIFVASASAAATIAAPFQGPQSAAHRSVLSSPARPWVEGVDPAMENRVFYATYGALQSHNVLKVYVFSAGGYESAGIRFSGRVPHEARDLTVSELSREAVILIRTAFDEFPEIQQLDVWATIPVSASQQTSVESTVFSVSADRDTYELAATGVDITDLGFLSAFGQIWIAPQVPR